MTSNFYTAPSGMAGGYIVYGGYRRQRGAGVLGSFRKYLAPVGKQALLGMKAIAKNKTVRKIAKKAAAKGVEVLAGVAVDALQGRNIGESLKERSREVALRSLTGGPANEATTTTTTPVVNNKRTRKRSRSRSRKPVKSLKQRKRVAFTTSSHRLPPAKKRRPSLSRAALNSRDLF